MRTTRATRTAVALALFAAASSALVACGGGGSQGTGGLAGVGSSTGVVVSPGVPSPTPSPTPHHTVKSHPTNTVTLSAPPSSAAGSPSRIIIATLHVQANYKIVVWGPCYWQLLVNDNNNLMVGTRFKITHSGLLAGSPVPFSMGDNLDHDGSYNNTEALDTVFPAAVGDDPGSTARYTGKSVLLTATISPATGSDDNPADNVAKTYVVVPSTGAPPADGTPQNIPCQAA